MKNSIQLSYEAADAIVRDTLRGDINLLIANVNTAKKKAKDLNANEREDLVNNILILDAMKTVYKYYSDPI